MTERDQLIDLIEDALADKGQYYELVTADPDRVTLVRSCGRAAGRRRGRKTQTFVAGGESEAQEVWVVDAEPLDPSDELARRRMDKRLRAVINAVHS